jgi:hypothetical protein
MTRMDRSAVSNRSPDSDFFNGPDSLDSGRGSGDRSPATAGREPPCCTGDLLLPRGELRLLPTGSNGAGVESLGVGQLGEDCATRELRCTRRCLALEDESADTKQYASFKKCVEDSSANELTSNGSRLRSVFWFFSPRLRCILCLSLGMLRMYKLLT